MIIGFSGYARSGKDTAARYFTDLGWRRDAFADRLRDFLYALDPIVYADSIWPLRLRELVDEIGWERAKVEYPEVADLLLRCGTEAGRQVLGQDVWVDAVFNAYRPGEDLVITDVRFPNEADRVRELGGIVVRINRANLGPRVTSTGELHISDIALDEYPFDWIFDNDGTVEDLHALLRYMEHVERQMV